MKFTTRELLMLTLMIAFALGWWLDRSKLVRENKFLEYVRSSSSDGIRAAEYEKFFQEEGYTVTRSENRVHVSGNNSSLSVPSKDDPAIRCGPAISN